jgi:cellobiose transport system substrate-binding protein
MRVTKRHLRQVAGVALAAFTALSVTAACNKSDTPTPGAKPAELIVDTFGEFGYEDLVKQYEQQNGIKITLRKTASLGDYTTKLVRYLATRRGMGDVVALEEGMINKFKGNPANWVDLKQYMPSGKDTQYLPFKWELGKAADGTQIGFPTDVGSLASCVRTDLFQAAGLPTDRDAITALWPTWDEFIKVGQTYKSKTGKGIISSITSVTNAVLFQGQPGEPIFYNNEDSIWNGEAKKENLVAASSPRVQNAWATAVKVLDAGISAKTQTWGPEWSAGFKQGTFAVELCPAWMLGIVKQNSGEGNSGKWTVAGVPGGSGNWGGSWLGVPSQTKYPAEAAKLADFLTNATSQVAAFKKSGPLPTQLQALQDPAFTGYTDPYFSDAPTGKIFGDSVKDIKPVNLGSNHAGCKEKGLESHLNALQSGQFKTQAEAWDAFLNNLPSACGV